MRDRKREKVDREKGKGGEKPKAASSEKQQAVIEKGDPGGLASVGGVGLGVGGACVENGQSTQVTGQARINS